MCSPVQIECLELWARVRSKFAVKQFGRLLTYRRWLREAQSKADACRRRALLVSTYKVERVLCWIGCVLQPVLSVCETLTVVTAGVAKAHSIVTGEISKSSAGFAISLCSLWFASPAHAPSARQVETSYSCCSRRSNQALARCVSIPGFCRLPILRILRKDKASASYRLFGALANEGDAA